ncbi:MAG: YggS family pyridoxal phosphate-dependent enzyme [Bacilli bacterium]|nr:YggS family pyridoxal phosphate-dependent enzyme [Bacilli bacterium]
MSIKENVERLLKNIDKIKIENNLTQSITICAATKYVGPNEMKELLKAGITNFGENRVQDFLMKYEELQGEPITWHFIGTLQTNKVKKMINKISYLHSLDRESLAEEINKHRETPLNCFVQVNCSGESSKHGLNVRDVQSFIYKLEKYDKIKIIGLMTMAEHTSDVEVLKQTFRTLRELRDTIKALKLPYAPCTELSMGMSNDYHIAILEGATVLRIGSLLYSNGGNNDD